MIEKQTTWSELKTISLGIGLTIKYVQYNSVYSCYIVDDPFVYIATVKKDGGADQVDFETNYQTYIDERKMLLAGKTSDNVQLISPIKNFAWNSITRVSHDFSDKRTWWQGSTTCIDEVFVNSGDNLKYDIPSDLVTKELISDRDVLATDYSWVIKKNGTVVTNYTIDPINKQIVFDTVNLVTDVVTGDGYKAVSSSYELIVDSNKYFLVDYVELQTSCGCQFNDYFKFEAVLNNPTTGNNDYTAGTTTYYTAKDYLNKSNNGVVVDPFGELTTKVIILPWNFVTGYKVFEIGKGVDPNKSEFNKLRVSINNDILVTNCEIATVTFYGYELKI